MSQGLKERIAKRSARVCVVGLGYVGLPLAVECARSGFYVTGIDYNESRVHQVNSGESYIMDISETELRDFAKSGMIRAVSEFSSVQDMDIVIICVPTGLSRNLDPDLQHVRKAAEEVALNLRGDQLICIESTIYPGTTEEIVVPILETSGFLAEQDFYVCHSPERIDPSNVQFNTANIGKIVGGLGQKSLDLGKHFYSQFIEEVVPVSSLKVAELAKIHENTFRYINIALVNELALVCDKFGVSVWDVLEAAFTKPFGIMPFFPGPGVGGHCIPIDPHYLEWRAREYYFDTRLISTAGEVNRKMPEFVREKVWRALNGMGKAPSRSRVLITGMAYKKDTSDYRESPAIRIAQLLLDDGVMVSFHDPFIPKIDVGTVKLTSVSLTEERVKQADLVLIAADHSGIDYRWLVETANLIIDTRNATKSIPGRDKKVILL